MPEFLKLVSLDEARELLFKNLPHTKLSEELLPTVNSFGRVLSRDVIAGESSPSFTRSAMDGYAVKSMDTGGASDSLPAYLTIIGEVEMGKPPAFVVDKGQTAVIHTGGMLPDGADAVVIMEVTQLVSAHEVEVHKPVTAGENLLLKGEDIKTGEVMLSAGSAIRSQEIGGLLAMGQTEVPVYARPIVHVFSCGDELIAPEQVAQPGQVRDINAPMLSALVDSCGGVPRHHPVVPDDSDLLENAIRSVLHEAALVIVTAGSSASARDMTADVIGRFGKPGVLVHGINVRPGKPTILAVCDETPIVGLPGNPVSALVIANLVVKPLVHALCGQTAPHIDAMVNAKLTVNLSSLAGRDDFLPAVVRKSPSGWEVDPVFFKSNLIFALTRANGLIHIPSDATGYAANDLVEVILLQR